VGKGRGRVTLAWPWAEESAARRLAPFEMEAGEAGEGWGSNGAERGGGSGGHGRGKGADRWVTTTVLGDGTG
jgi:hypothetical protein